MIKDINFPNELKPYIKYFESSLRPILRIKADNRVTGIKESKFGGIPYFPKDIEYPTDSVGNPLVLLAQINFEEMRQNDFLPSKGILQFYISQNQHLGVNYVNMIEQKDFKVMYFESAATEEDHLSEYSFININKDFPIQRECKLFFELGQEFVNTTDELMFKKIFNSNPVEFFNNEEIFEYEEDSEKYFNQFCKFARGQKIGGYPYFIQNDPRVCNPEYSKYDILLLQIDTDNITGIHYGMRGGTANFLINEQDLKNKDFSKIMYYWCD